MENNKKDRHNPSRKPQVQGINNADSASYDDQEAARKVADSPRAANFDNNGETSEANDASDTGKMAINPALSHEDIVPADATPSDKKVVSAITGAEEEGEIGSAAAAAGFTGGTAGAGTSSESRKGNPENYGSNQTGPGLATGPMRNTPSEDNG